MANNFVAKIIKESALVYDIRTKRGGSVGESGGGFMILQVEKSKHSAFQQKMAGEASFDATEYGIILHQGEGEPSIELKRILNEKFGMYGDQV